MAESNIELSEQTATDSLNPTEIERLTALLESDLDEPKADETSDQEADEAIVEDEVVDVPEDEIAEDEEVETDPTDDSEAEDAEKELKFTVGDETVALEELKLGYLRQSDYTRKTQNIATVKRDLETKSAETDATMSALLTAAGADLSRFEGVNWEQVAIDTPDQYKQAKAAHEQTQSTYHYIKAQADKFQAEQQQQTDAANKESAAESLTVLKSSIPNWNNDLYYKIGNYAQGLGVSGEEFNKVSDHRLITALWKAMQFDQAKTVTAKKKIKPSATKTLSGSKADSTKAVETESTRVTRERLKKTGSVNDAAAALLSRMN
jgi:hypothetical protein